MLNLTRFPTESIQIGDEITVVVLGVNGQQVRIGVEAPRDVAVLREELVERAPGGHAHRQAATYQEREVKSDSLSAAPMPTENKTKVIYKRRRSLHKPIES